MAMIQRCEWDPFYGIGELNRLFDKTHYKGDKEGSNIISATGISWNPYIDVQEKKNSYVLRVELPGLEKEDIKVSLDENTITIKGEKKYESGKDDKGRYYRECSYGKFQRSIKLASDIESEKIEASYKNGVLRLVLLKKDHEATRKIEIKVK